MTNVDEVKERISIEEVVGGYVTLKQAGSNMKGKCPFHAEKTPSFVVSPLRQTYHCFGCGVGGDIFTFIQEIEGLDFRGSLKLLADKAGVTLTHDTSGVKKDEKEVLFEILEHVTQYYEVQFEKNSKAIAYLEQRGVSKDTMHSFRIGFAPEGWSSAHDELVTHTYQEQDIEQAGITKQGERGAYDRFRSRIMFPITDSVGRVVAFSGRIFPKENDATGKYINSPETALYHKSKILYGYDRARQSIRKKDFSILVEGQMDLIMTHQCGYTNTVALSGTALTHEHLTLLGRMSHNVVIALDADDAGIASAMKSARAALKEGFDVKIAVLPKGADPADILAQGDTRVWKDAVKNSQHIVDFLLLHYRDKESDERMFKKQVERHVLPFLNEIPSEIDKSHFVQRVAAQLCVSEEAVRREMSNAQVSDNTRHKDIPHKNTNIPHVQPNHRADRELVLIYVWQASLKKPFIDIKRLQTQIEDVLTPLGFKALCEMFKDDTEAAFRLELLYQNEEAIKAATFDLLERLDKQKISEAIEKTAQALRKAESEGNTEAIAQHETHYQTLIDKRIQLEKHL